MKKIAVILLALLLLCSCSKDPEPAKTGDEFLDGLAFDDIKLANRIDRVLEDGYIYYERSASDKEGKITEQEYVEFVRMNGELAVVREAKYPSLDYSYQVCCKQEGNESYAAYAIVDGSESIIFMDAAVYDLNTRMYWYLSETTTSYVHQAIEDRSYDEEGDVVIIVSDESNSQENVTRRTAYTLDRDSLKIQSMRSEIFRDSSLWKTEEIAVTAEDRAIMIPVAYNRMDEGDLMTVVFHIEKTSFDVEYRVKKGIECMVLHYDKSAHLQKDGSDEPFYYFVADEEHSDIYMLEN